MADRLQAPVEIIGAAADEDVLKATDTSGEVVLLIGATKPGTYTPSNVTASRTFDADTVDVAGLADVVGTLLTDLQALKLIG